MGHLPSSSRRHPADVAGVPDGWRREGDGPPRLWDTSRGAAEGARTQRKRKSAQSGGNRSERRAIKLYHKYITDEEE
mgnify:CR=1 FL=1